MNTVLANKRFSFLRNSSGLSVGKWDTKGWYQTCWYSGFQMTVEKPKPEQLLLPITTGTNSAMNQSQSLAITCNSLEAREKSRVHGGGFASHWLKNWRDSFKPITKRSNCNHVITFDGHLKTALSVKFHSTVKRQWITKQTFPALSLIHIWRCRRS